MVAYFMLKYEIFNEIAGNRVVKMNNDWVLGV